MTADGKIDLDDEFAVRLGFTSDKFEGWLWKTGDRITISMIISLQEGKGHLSHLFSTIEREGFRVAVPTPFAHMVAILKRKGFQQGFVEDEVMGRVEIWMKP